MINSRSLDDLLPRVRALAELFLAKCHSQGIDIIITSTYRDNASQAELYAQGRTKPGRKVTNAMPGQSWHNWKCAFDVVPLRQGKPVWGTTEEDDYKLWNNIGSIGESVGLTWAGRWSTFKEFPHFQFTAGLTIEDFKEGKTLPPVSK
jgi:peptidoglycan L-alanyl-D-glutamate endopeptidase CwlK